MDRPAGVFDVRYEQDMAVVRTGPQWATLIGFLILLAVLPLFAGSYFLSFMILTGIALIAVLGLNILTGYAGQISLGHQAFVAVGAYTTAVLMDSFHWNFWATVPMAGIAAAGVGVLFGLPSFRLKMLYLTMSTLAAQFIIMAFFNHAFPDYFHSVSGIRVNRPELWGIDFRENEAFYYVVIVIAVLMTFFAKNLVRSRSGRAFVAIRDNDLAGEVIGINVARCKLYAFAIGCFYAGIAGSLWATYFRNVNPPHFHIDVSIWYLGCLIVGGMGTTVGAVFGVLFLRIIKELVTFISPILGEMVSPINAPKIGPGLAVISWALVVVLFLIFEPRGLAHTWEVLKSRFRHWPFKYSI
ncbi:MAG: branched-chain amino acid ABC transporter permease [Thermodesulfobacteriota bacterium]|jgi:branched-chain amino acid transport system permease protein